MCVCVNVYCVCVCCVHEIINYNMFPYAVHPVIQVPNQLVGAPLGTDVTLECYVESSPKSINYWVRDSSKCILLSLTFFS